MYERAHIAVPDTPPSPIPDAPPKTPNEAFLQQFAQNPRLNGFLNNLATMVCDLTYQIYAPNRVIDEDTRQGLHFGIKKLAYLFTDAAGDYEDTLSAESMGLWLDRIVGEAAGRHGDLSRLPVHLGQYVIEAVRAIARISTEYEATLADGLQPMEDALNWGNMSNEQRFRVVDLVITADRPLLGIPQQRPGD